MTAPTALSFAMSDSDLTFEQTNPADQISDQVYTIDLSDGFNGSCGFVGSLIYEGAEYNNHFPFLTYSAENQQLIVQLDENLSVIGAYEFQYRMISEAIEGYDQLAEYPFIVTMNASTVTTSTVAFDDIESRSESCISDPVMENTIENNFIRLT